MIAIILYTHHLNYLEILVGQSKELNYVYLRVQSQLKMNCCYQMEMTSNGQRYTMLGCQNE